MATDTIQANYDQLATISQRFRTHSESIQTTHEKLAKLLRALEDSWVGRGAEAFRAEMDDAILPAVSRLTDVLAKSAATISQISTILQEAEKEAARLFSHDEGASSTARTHLTGFGDDEFSFDLFIFGPYGRLRENFFDLSDYVVDADKLSEWIRDAGRYHDVPPELIAAILQQENPPDAPLWQKPLQYAERQATTIASILNDVPLVGRVIPDSIAEGSTGIGNMQGPTLRSAAEYIERTYGRPVLPDQVESTAIPFVNRDTRKAGVDMQADVYYVSAHLRQLIDEVAGGGQPYHGPLTRAQIQQIAARYNGSGDAAEEYGRDTLRRLDEASG